MVKKTGTSSEYRKFTFSSFRDRVDSIKIEPTLHLSRKAFHEAEISHFLSTLDHWKEVNLSKSFGELVEVIEPLSLSLPQLLFYQTKIFDSLMHTLSLNDELSLQPTLELLSQFCHDLGPDFMPYYSRALQALNSVALHQTKSDPLEWAFNTLAYIFKYLSKELSKDLNPTFDQLLPLLTLEKKDYITKFASQAISFLVKKATPASLESFIKKVFTADELLEQHSENYHGGLVIIFSEAFMNSAGTLHSKSSIILIPLVSQCLLNARSQSVLSDIIMTVLNHTENTQMAQPLYTTILKVIEQQIDDKDDEFDFIRLISITQTLTTLAFAQSGVKVNSWSEILKYVNKLSERSKSIMIESDEDEVMKINFGNAMVQFCSILIRNSDSGELAKYHIHIFNVMMKLNDNSVFLPFVNVAIDLTKEKTLSYCKKYVTSFIAQNWKLMHKEIAYFLSQMNQKGLIHAGDPTSELHVILPTEFSNFILKIFEDSQEIKEDHDLIDIYWRFLVLQNTELKISTDSLMEYFKILQKRSSNDLFSVDLAGSLMMAISNQDLDDQRLFEIVDCALSNFEKLKTSTQFLQGLNKHLQKTTNNDTKTLELIRKNRESLIYQVVENLITPSHTLREYSLNIILTVFEKSTGTTPELINICRVIEQVPLELHNGRDIQTRYRNLQAQFIQSEQDNLINLIIVKFIFGQLSNRFSPTWEGAINLAAAMVGRAAETIWESALKFITFKYNDQIDPVYYEQEMSSLETPDDLSDWLPRDTRIATNIETSEKFCRAYHNVDLSLVEFAETSRENLKFIELSRSQSIKLLIRIPTIAETRFKSLFPYVVNEDIEDDVETGSVLEGWNTTDRNSLIELLAHFKKPNTIYGADRVFEFLMRLLSNKSTKVQTLALNSLLNWKNPVFNKYQENLKNMLDDTLFRDEVTKFLQNDEEDTIEVNDVDTIMPLILRILFGRAQTLKTSGTKQGRKMAAIKILSNLQDKHIAEFLSISFEKLEFSGFMENSKIDPADISTRILKHLSGFLNMVLEVLPTLGKAQSTSLSVLIEPLSYALSVSEAAINAADEIEGALIEKIARNNRQIGFKILYEITTYLGEDFNWTPYGDILYNNLIQAKMQNFAQENLQQPSALMKLMTSLWSQRNLQFFLFYDDYLPVRSMLQILPNSHAKDSVLLAILDFILSLLSNTSEDDDFVNVMAIVISECLDSLVLLFDISSNKEVNSKAVEILLTLIQRDYVTDNDARKVLVSSLTAALEKSNNQIELSVKANIIRILSAIVRDFDCSVAEIIPLYTNLARLFRVYPEREMRIVVSEVFVSMGERFIEFVRVGTLVSDLTAYSSKRIREADFERRLNAFSLINQTEYLNLSAMEWLPIICISLFFINDEQDQSMRSSAAFTLKRFIDCSSSKDSEESAADYIKLLVDDVLPHLKTGLRKKHELVQNEYINVICHIIESSRYYHGLDDMKILLHNGDEEANFFKNINHPQLHRRQRAIRRLPEFGSQLTVGSISHWILPMIEHYAYWTDEKLRNIANETGVTIAKLMTHVTWNQFRAIFSRYISIMNQAKAKERNEQLRDAVSLVVLVSASLKDLVESDSKPKDFPATAEKLDGIVINEFMPPLRKVLTTRDEATVLSRVSLSEALTSLIMCCSQDKVNSELPGILTNICHILRARSEDLRDTIRKHLGRIAVSLGPTYLKFILKELRGALARGPQIHILSFTVHYVLVALDGKLNHGDLGDVAELVIEIVMNDVFGTTSQEKEAEGYNNKMKEIKHNKSYDTGEMIASNIFLKDFGHLMTPVKYLLQERLALKTQNRLDELLRRFSLGLNRNEESSSTDILVLCYEIYNQSLEIVNQKKDKAEVSEKDDHFLVQLDARPIKTQVEYSLYVKTMQKFSFELLRTAITKNDSLFTASNLSDFVPILETSITADDEGVIISALRVLTMMVRLDFPEELNGRFTACARSTLKIVKDMPSTNNDLCQSCLKFLSSIIRHKEDLQLKDTALSYILKKIEPDLDEPMRQGVAFGFVKSLISKHTLLPEIYDTMDIVSRIMITSTSSEIRAVSRSVFFTFLMEYDQSRGRLEKQFKMLINNLEYPAQSGRQSVMELIHLVVNKSGKELLQKLSSSFFIALSNVAITDDAPFCRELASEVISLIFTKLEKLSGDFSFVEKFISMWISQKKSELLTRCGLNSYKLYVSAVGFEKNPALNEVAIERLSNTFFLTKKSDELEEVNWELVYSSLVVFEKLGDSTNIYASRFESSWISIFDSLLYPHSWVRLLSSRLITNLLQTIVEKDGEGVEFETSDAQLQTIAYRLFRQLGASSISQKLANQVAKNLVFITKKWNNENTPFIRFSSEKDEIDDDEAEEKDSPKFKSALDWAMNRCSAILKNESRPNKDMLVTKKAIIQYCAFLTSFLGSEKLAEIVSAQILIPLINISEQEVLIEDDQEDNSLPSVATRCMDLISNKLGVSEYNLIYSNAKKIIYERRQERKTRKAQLSLQHPAAAAQRKLKKHARFREKRKADKDENGLYKAKRKKTPRA
ncbi:hypothetical protein CANARDRAFT_10220 [[Candida] arabinofermentans NRRL YB-2248]|uniref:Uncharacterized protein n=1 Tax=[Candida] arabinofermentans NRRL YB-2248 TaxID=983967 RepID=A0A1E4STE4_9ASCO|nr:hypothetical protein CANARDRAFT_10220 [[Candida] arabinofermentans NRRL YB-2248]